MMSGLGPRTKKVTTYGKKRTGIVSLYRDEQIFTPTKHDTERESDWVTTKDSVTPIKPKAATATAKRAPLTSKLSNDLINVPSTPARRELGKKGSKTGSDIGSEIVCLDLKVDKKKEKEKSIRTEVKKATSTKATRPKKQVSKLDGVILPISNSARKDDASLSQITTVSEVTEDISSLSINADEVHAPDPTPTASWSTSRPTLTHAEELERLVSSCTSTKIHDFSNFITSPAVSSLLEPDEGTSTSSSTGTSTGFRKIGEASYSEVFSMGIAGGHKIVIKVIPLVGEDEGQERRDVPDTSYPKDVLRELEITQRMGGEEGSTSSFVNLLGSFIVKGKYPQVLLDQWWEYKTSMGSSSACPELFGDDQHYALIVLSDGGVDLESFKFDTKDGWKQASSIFWQVANAISEAEAWTSFEHRDLHEGQILIAPTRTDGDDGVTVTIIDFGLSRLTIPDQSSPAWSDLPPEVYEGKGDQWDVYRSMRDKINGDWAGFHPETNVMWLHYLVRYLLNRTSLRKPRIAALQRSRRARAPRKSDIVDEGIMAAYEGLKVVEEMLKAALAGEGEEIKSAGDVVRWGKSKA